MNFKPIRPEEVSLDKMIKEPNFPKEIIDIFNKLIIKNYQNGEVVIYQNDVLALIEVRLNLDRTLVLDKKWLNNIELLYRCSGWDVFYDHGGCCIGFEPRWNLREKKVSGVMGTKFKMD